ncbi:hypothetical protein J1N35_035536 [Gossypium stocksii]|uniref:Reverse transcriptase domain-containing protein n=1 Tax=Gossypium stocksii TaxID=47602 RepID=A0A9D3ZQ82_9ROSI|nr:hypothetical protein J1N35_035536 [Gossypium stocksii]
MMRRIGFCKGCISLIIRCISSVTYSVVVNGKIGEEFSSQRGLRQGDLLSPYLFLTCAEGFSRLIVMARIEGRLIGTKVERDANIREQVGGILGVKISNNPKKYMGLPTMVGRPKKHAFTDIKERFLKLLNNWSLQLLSARGIKDLTLRLPSEVFGGLDAFLKRESDGELGMGTLLIFGMMFGCRGLEVEEFNKQDVIRAPFGEEQLKHILSIPLVSSRPRDELIWRGDNTGLYTVKSGYKWTITFRNPRLHNDDSFTFFTKMWGLKLPICQAEEETVCHLFRDCTFTEQVLQGMGVTGTSCNRETYGRIG